MSKWTVVSRLQSWRGAGILVLFSNWVPEEGLRDEYGRPIAWGRSQVTVVWQKCV